jgi:hypothetical protein
MTLFARSLWPETVRRPYLRLAAAVVAAPLLLMAVLSLLAFVVAGSSEATREGTMEVTVAAARMFAIVLPAFTLTFGLGGVALNWLMGWRGVLAWLATGAGAGALAAVVGLLGRGGDVAVPRVLIAAVVGAVIFFLIRWIAGIRLR